MARIPATPGPLGFHSPILQVHVVVGKDRRLQVTALLDSGADRTVVPRKAIEALGINFDKLKKPVGADGAEIKGQGAGGEMEIRVCRGKVRWRTTVICTEFWVTDCDIVLLGRDDFFRKFDVMFDWSAPIPYVDIEPAGTMRAQALA